MDYRDYSDYYSSFPFGGEDQLLESEALYDFPEDRQFLFPGFPGVSGPTGQQPTFGLPGMPPGPPPGIPGGGPGGGAQPGGPPTSPPPAFTPQLQQGGISPSPLIPAP